MVLSGSTFSTMLAAAFRSWQLAVLKHQCPVRSRACRCRFTHRVVACLWLAEDGEFPHRDSRQVLASLPLCRRGPWQLISVTSAAPLGKGHIVGLAASREAHPKATFMLGLVFCKDFKAKQLQIQSEWLPLPWHQPLGVAWEARAMAHRRQTPRQSPGPLGHEVRGPDA